MNITDFSSLSEKVSPEYVSPKVEIVTVEVEKGFSSSIECYETEDGTWD